MFSIPQIQLNVVRAYIAQTREKQNVAETEVQNALLSVLAAYEREQEHAVAGTEWNLDELALVLRPASRLAAQMLYDTAVQDPPEMAGWHLGAEATNDVQFTFALVCEIETELRKSIRRVEAVYPHLKQQFDTEADNYGRQRAKRQRSN